MVDWYTSQTKDLEQELKQLQDKKEVIKKEVEGEYTVLENRNNSIINSIQKEETKYNKYIKRKRRRKIRN